VLKCVKLLQFYVQFSGWENFAVPPVQVINESKIELSVTLLVNHLDLNTQGLTSDNVRLRSGLDSYL
jgi:hypothetical protein